MGEAVEVWRGAVAAWECDSLGHLNVGFYTAKAMEGLIGLAAELGMPHAFAPHGEATLIVREKHIRFLREAFVDARLHIEAGVLEMGEDDAQVLLLMRHHDGELAATFQMRVAHVTAREARPFPWPSWARARAAAITIEIPERARPRGVSPAPAQLAGSLPRALELGLQRIGLGGFRAGDCDPFGRMRTEQVMARISDSLVQLIKGPLDDLAAARGRNLTAVGLEYRLVYADWPRTGDRYEVRSGMVGAEPLVRRMVHWLLDPKTGRPWAAAEAILAVFDLDTRKTVTLDDAERAAWAKLSVPGLSL